jgi:hypothetical protein
VDIVTLVTITHLIAQCASNGTYNGAKRSKNGTQNSTAQGSYRLIPVVISPISNTILVFSHPSHSLVL